MFPAQRCKGGVRRRRSWQLWVGEVVSWAKLQAFHVLPLRPRHLCCSVLALIAWLCVAPRARADGAMVLGKRELFRVGPATRQYCETDGGECDKVMAKYLSSYGFLRGALRGGAVLSSPDAAPELAGFGALHLDGASAALPGGDMAAGRLDLVVARRQILRVRLTVLDLESMFACTDAHSGKVALPFVGMVTKRCRGDAVLGVDLRLFRLQWDVNGNLTEWLSAGPAFELLGNGLGYAHVLRSLVVALPIDVQSRLSGSAPRGTSLGVGARISALLRTPQWETRLRVRQRTALASPVGFAREHSVDAELRVLRNWFAHDSVVLQAGLSFGFDWASYTWAGQSIFSARDARLGFQAGLYLGWVNEAPAI